MKLMVLVEGVKTPYRPGDLAPARPVTPTAPVGGSAFSRAREAYEQQRRQSGPPKKLLVEAADVMSSPVRTITPDARTRAVWEQFRDSRFRHLPVSRDGKQLVGIVSDRDILKWGQEADGPVSEVMTRRVLTATPSTSIREVARAMFDERIGCLPVLDDDSVVGIITRTDILRALMTNAPIELWG